MTETVTIERLGARGDGLSYDGLAIAGALPSERVEIVREGRRGRLVAVVDASSERKAAFCGYYERCGGCVMQHLAPEPYAIWKRGIVAQALEQARIDTDLRPLVDAHGAGRRRITLHVRVVEGRARAGLMAARSHALTPIEACPITVPALHAAPRIAEALAQPLGAGRKPLDVVATATAAGLDIDLRGHGPLSETARAALIRLAKQDELARLSLHGETLIEHRAPILASADIHLTPPPGGFVQATEAGQFALTELVRGAVEARAKRVADLFAGSGPFSLALAAAHEVHAVEADDAALRGLDRAARSASGLRRITTERRDLFRRPLLLPDLARFDAIVFDPPRAGAQAQVAWIAQSSVPLVVAVSCDAGTFARDAAALIAGGYRLERVTPVDQFKYSSHVEIVGVFRKAPARRRR